MIGKIPEAYVPAESPRLVFSASLKIFRYISVKSLASAKRVGDMFLFRSKKSMVRRRSRWRSARSTSSERLDIYVADNTNMFPNCLFLLVRKCLFLQPLPKKKKTKFYLEGGGERKSYACAVPNILVTIKRPLIPSKASVLRIADSIQILHARLSLVLSSL